MMSAASLYWMRRTTSFKVSKKSKKLSVSDNAQRLALMKEVEAATERMHGRVLRAIELEAEAERLRLQAQLQSLDELERRQAEVALAQLNQRQAEQQQQSLSEFDALTGETEGNSLQDELARIEEREQARLDKLEELRTEELESLRDFEAAKTQIEKEADEERLAARQAALEAQLSAVKSTVGNISSVIVAAAGEGSKAARAAAKVEQGVELGRAIISTAGGIARAFRDHAFPASLGVAASVGALGAAQIATISSQTFAQGGIDIQGPGTSTSDSIPARISRGESVITALGTQRNRDVLTMANRGVDVASALAAPTVVASGPANMTFSPTITVQGSVDEDVLPVLVDRLKSDGTELQAECDGGHARSGASDNAADAEAAWDVITDKSPVCVYFHAPTLLPE